MGVGAVAVPGRRAEAPRPAVSRARAVHHLFTQTSGRVVPSRRPTPIPLIAPRAIDTRFEAVVFDWDGTAVPDRRADAQRLRALVEQGCGLGLELAIITGTNLENVDAQLGARPPGPGRLHLCLNRGSEVYVADETGVRQVARREATPEEDAALDAAAEATVSALARRGVHTVLVSQRLNRRKIDLIPEPEWADPPKARIGELLTAVLERLARAGLRGLDEAVELALGAALDAGLPDARVTSDAKHVEIGLTDKSDSARWTFDELRSRGIGPGLVLVGGDEFGSLGGLPGSDSFLLVPEASQATAVSVGAEPNGAPAGVIPLGGGPERFLELLDDQIERRRRRAVPSADPDPAWSLTVDGFDARLERVHESLLTIADGRLGTRGNPVLSHPACLPGVLAVGVYELEGTETRLAACPDWTLLDGELPVDPVLRRRLDLRAGILRQDVALPEGTLAALQLSSLERPGTVALRAEGPDGVLPEAGRQVTDGPLVRAVVDVRHPKGFERLAAYDGDEATARARLGEAEEAGFEQLLAEHRARWGRRWDEADVVIEGDPELQQAVRVCLFHLMASVPTAGEAAVGARGLSGPGYRGHVFWDSDVFVLPFLAATQPAAARAMLEYRIRRLPAALAAAAQLGRSGARFPWESAADGSDVTPAKARDQTGRLIPIRTGELEEHIVADVAWAASQLPGLDR